MSIKKFLARIYASIINGKIKSAQQHIGEVQLNTLKQIVENASNTAFGLEHQFSSIKNYEEFKKQVPLRTYEDFENYIDKIKLGSKNVLWPGSPVYFAKSSGTTSGVKYIPITADSIPNHIHSARNALLQFIHAKGNADFVDGKMIFLSGSPVLEKVNGILIGRLSGIVNHHVPAYLKKNQLPSYATNCIDDWEQKVEKIVEETMHEDMRLISGIPPWMQMYFDKLLERTGKQHVIDVFPNLQLIVYGGVNFEPYRDKLFSTIGKKVACVETYPASEGFIAYQVADEKGLQLNADSGIFFEFIEMNNGMLNEEAVCITDVKTEINYAIALSSNAGLWRYLIGDTVKFISINPYKIVVTGRIKHFISAFGEHVIVEEVEHALKNVCAKLQCEVIEFTVAPQVNPQEGLPYHEWFIEFGKQPEDLFQFEKQLDEEMRMQNIYYDDLITGGVLKPLVIQTVKQNGFRDMMKAEGKLGGQNKVPRLTNDRMLAEKILIYCNASY